MSYLAIERDFIKGREHLYYLIEYENDGTGEIIASYSIKTDKLTIRKASNYIPLTTQLRGFIAEARTHYKEKNYE